jgi:hypothetical protein
VVIKRDEQISEGRHRIRGEQRIVVRDEIGVEKSVWEQRGEQGSRE